MNTESLLTEFNQLSEAPDALQHLRRFILDLAVRGRLAEQVASDEPASELLSRIESHMSDQGTRRRKYTSVSPAGAPYQLPQGWEWVRVRHISADRGQTRPTESFTYIDVGSIDNEAGRIADAVVLTANKAPSRARKIVKRGDVLYSCVRPYLLNIAVVEQSFEPTPIASTAFAVLDAFGLVSPGYLWTVLRSPFMVEQVELKMRGQAYPAINDSDFAQLPFPLPPLAEQQRIVRNVDELMALCDQLNASQRERETIRDRVRVASLGRLSDERPSAEHKSDVEFFVGSYTRIITRPDQIPALRQAVIDMAIKGRLTDVRAATRQHDPAPLIKQSWVELPLGELLTEDSKNGYAKKPDGAAHGIPILKISAGTIRVDGVVEEREHKLTGNVSPEDYERYQLRRGDLLACRFNGNRDSVGRVIFMDLLGMAPIYPDKLIRIRVDRSRILPEICPWFFRSTLLRERLAEYAATTVGNWGISAHNLKQVLIPVPPIAEQQTILGWLDEMMSICDELERSFLARQLGRSQLLGALLRDALLDIGSAAQQALSVAT